VSRRWLLVAFVAGLAAVAAIASFDARAWDRALDRGDRAYAETPRRARWNADTRLPGDPIGRALRVEGKVALRRALRAFLVAERTPRGLDNGERRAEARAAGAGALVAVSAGDDTRLASRAYDLLGVLAATGDSIDNEQALAAFDAAVRADGANADAKYNLELLLRRTRASDLRRGQGGGSGPRGGLGAGAADAGSGY
jgi:hypothetical protein